MKSPYGLEMNNRDVRVRTGRLDRAAEHELAHRAEHGAKALAKILVKPQVDEKVHDIGEREREAGERVDTKIAIVGHERHAIEKSEAVTEHRYNARREHH